MAKKNVVTDLAVPGEITPVGLVLPEQLSFPQWEAVIQKLGMVTKACMWWWGDALNFGERKYGEMYAQALDAGDYEYQSLRNAAWVAGRIELSRRRDNLSWGHHAEVAGLPPEQQNVLLAQADAEELSRDELRRAVHRAKASVQIQPVPSKLYRVIYADPPWKYNDKLVEGYGPAEHHYTTMSIDELVALKVAPLAAPDAVLFLWVTSPLLKDCFQIIEAWGFEYKTSFVWDKVKHNMGHYNSVRHEFLLVCTRGRCVPDVPTLIDSVQTIERSDKHSEKPEEFRSMIDLLYPSGKRIELFSRTSAKGWDAWGNEKLA